MPVGGYVGRILFVNLTSGELSSLNTLDYTDYIGGKGIGLRLQWELGNPEIKDGFDADSLLMFLTGPLTGTPAPASGRTTLCYKQVSNYPKQWWSHSSFGGAWGPELKFAGFDGIIIKGVSDKHVYLWIHNGVVEIKDASKLWGLDTYATEDRIRQELGNDPGIRIMKIGPAGENQLRGSCILTDVDHAAGQNTGGIMGRKNLKAIAVRGTGGVPIARLGDVLADRQKHLQMLYHSTTTAAAATALAAGNDYKSGSACFSCTYPCHTYVMPSKGPRGGNFCGWANGYNWSRTVHLGLSQLKKTPFGDYYQDPKVGATKYQDDVIPEYSKLFDLYGISGYDMLGVRLSGSFLMTLCYDEVMGDSFRKFIVEEVGDLPGSETFAQNAPRMVTYRQGRFGKLLAQDILYAAMELRDNPADYGLSVEQGQFCWETYERLYIKNYSLEHHFYRPSPSNPMYDIRDIEQSPVTEMLTGLGTRDTLSSHHAFHLITDENVHGASLAHAKVVWGNEESAAKYLNADGKPVIKNQLNSPKKDTYYTYDLKESKPVKPNFTVGTPEALYRSLALGIQTDSLCLCDWLFPVVAGGMIPCLTYVGNPQASNLKDIISDPSKTTDIEYGARLYSAVTGIDKTFDDLFEDSVRCLVLERAIHMRDNDRTREDDYFNNYVHNRPDANGITLPKDELKNGYDAFAQIIGFDKETGNPTRMCLEKYGLKDVADTLESIGRLPG